MAAEVDKIYEQIGRQYALNYVAIGSGIGRLKPKNCKKGWSCGYSCQSKDKKNCRSALKGQAKTYADWLGKQADRIESDPLRGFKVTKKGRETTYSTEVNGHKLDIILQSNPKSTKFDFKVDDSFARGEMNSRTGAAILGRVRRIAEFTAKSLPDGHKIKAEPMAGDTGMGDRRFELYERFGFKRKGIFEMEAVVKNGKIARS